MMTVPLARLVLSQDETGSRRGNMPARQSHSLRHFGPLWRTYSVRWPLQAAYVRTSVRLLPLPLAPPEARFAKPSGQDPSGMAKT